MAVLLLDCRMDAGCGVGSAGAEHPPAWGASSAGGFCFDLGQRLGREAECNPILEPTFERAHAMDPASLEHERHTGARGFVGSAAVEDDVAVAWKLDMTRVDLFERNDLRCWNLVWVHLDREFVA